MGIHFVIGRAGTGKSQRAFDAIVAAMRADPLGPPIFWLLPKQATFTAERSLAVASGLDGFCRTQVLSFHELGSRVLEDCGGAAVPHVDELGRQMVLGHLLRQHEPELRYFKSVARQAGLAAELDATFAELERCGKSSDDLAALLSDFESAASLDHQDQSLLAKLHDLRLLYEAYDTYLGQERLDPHRRLAQVVECIEKWSQMQGATVYIDGFLEFTDYERRIIAAMATTCRQVEVNLMLDPDSPILSNPHHVPDDLSPFFRVEDTYRRLWFTLHEEGIDVGEALRLRDVRRFRNAALKRLESHLLRTDGATEAANADGIALIETYDRRAEIDAAARQVRTWVQAGLRYRDIAVLTRDLADYHEIIHASFREHEIPFFVDRRRTAAHHPLLQFTRAVFLIALHDWQHEAVMTALKSGMAGLELEEIDELENYVLLHRIRGEVWAQREAWRFRRVLTRGSEDEIPSAEIVELDRVDALRRRFVQPLQQFLKRLRKPQLTVRQIVIDLFDLYKRFHIRKTLLGWMESARQHHQLELHDEHAQIWTRLVELFDQMVDLLGDERVSPREFLEILEFGLEQFDLALTPPTVDQVLVGSMERTRNPQSRAVILVGMNDGQIPRVSREDSILSDGERQTLRSRRLELDGDSERRLFDENLLAYVGFTRAAEFLTLTRSLADDDNRPQEPSPYWMRLRELLPDVPVQSIVRDPQCVTDCIGTPRQLVNRLMRWVRAGSPSAEDASDSPWPSLYQWLATHSCCDDSIDVMRYRAWKALSYANEARLSPEVARQLFASPLNASVSRIETFATCPYKHFARYGLKLEPREESDVTALDLGNVYHEVLEKLVREMIRSRRSWGELSADQTRAAITRYAREVAETLRGELMLSSARNKYLLQRIEKTLEQVIASHEAAARRSKLIPKATELGFGIQTDDDAALPPYTLRTPGGNEVKLYGKIDRVDLIEDRAAFAVIDYKLRGSRLELQRVYYGLSLQLLTYLLVLHANSESLFGRKLTPAAAFYVRLMRQLERTNHPSDAVSPEDPLFDLQEVPRGIFDGKFVRDLDSEAGGGKRSEFISAYVKEDGNFGYRSSTDVAETGEFVALLRHVERKLAELSDQIIAGQIQIAPYRIRQESPCAHCEFSCLCRFDVLTNHYHILEPIGRERVLERTVQEMGRDD